MKAKRPHPLVAEAITIAGSQAKLAEAAGCSQQAISFLLNGRMGMSAEMAVRLDRATGGRVPKEQLRPDLFETTGAAA